MIIFKNNFYYWNNIQSCEIAYSEVDNNHNRVLRDIYLKKYICPYDKYIKIINGDEKVEIQNYDDISSSNSDESLEEEKDLQDNNNDEKKEENWNNKDNNNNNNKNSNNTKDSHGKEENEKDKNSGSIRENNEHHAYPQHHKYGVKKLKIKNSKYMKALKYFHDNFELRKKEEDKLSIDSINSELELDEEEQDLLNSKSNLYTIKKKLKKNLKN